MLKKISFLLIIIIFSITNVYANISSFSTPVKTNHVEMKMDSHECCTYNNQNIEDINLDNNIHDMSNCDSCSNCQVCQTSLNVEIFSIKKVYITKEKEDYLPIDNIKIKSVVKSLYRPPII